MANARVKLIEGKTFLGRGRLWPRHFDVDQRRPGRQPHATAAAGVGGCTAMDVVDILRKQRQPLADLEIEIGGERGEEYPKPWTRLHVHYIFYGAEPGFPQGGAGDRP